MNKFIKQVAIVAIAVTALSASTTTQAQADSSFNRTILGAVAIGVVINQVKKNKTRNRNTGARQVSRSNNNYTNPRYGYRDNYRDNNSYDNRRRHGSSHRSFDY